jgi:type I restriction enzyme S subunit
MMSRLVPKLRFKEFSGEWEERKLGGVVKFLDGKRKPIKESDRANMQGEYPYYGASGIIDYVNDFIFDEDIILLSEDGENIVSRNLPLVFKVAGKSWVNNHAHVLKPQKLHKLDFLVQYMENLSYVRYNSGGAQPKLNQAVCKTIPLILPIPKEQQKIASCLSSLDSLIEAQNKKVSA